MAVGGGSWLHPDIDEQDRSVPGRGTPGPRSEQLCGRHGAVSGRPQSSRPHAPQDFAPYQQPPYPQWARTEFNHISADGHTKQHVGHVYNTTSHSHYYSAPDRVANDTLREQRGRALLKAAKEGQKPVVKRPLGAGADIEFTQPENGYSALHYASEGGYEDVVEFLVEAGADVNLMSERYGTALHLACLKGQAAIASCLLQARADVHARAADIGQPLHCAIFHGSAEICTQLLSRGAKVNDRGDLHYGTMQSISCGDHILGAIRGHMDCFPIDVAIDRENLELVKLLIKNGAKFDFPCPRWSPPWYHGDMVCLPGRANVIEGIRPVIRAACLKHNATLGFLLDSGASIYTDDGRGMNAVMYAARSGSAACLQILVSRLGAMDTISPPMSGAVPLIEYITQRCDDGHNALELAVQGWHRDCVSILCKTLILKPCRLLWGPKPLNQACKQGHSDVVTTLLKAGFDANSRDERGYTPILNAVAGWHEYFDLNIFIELARQDAALDACGADGRTVAQSLLGLLGPCRAWDSVFRLFITIISDRSSAEDDLLGGVFRHIWKMLDEAGRRHKRAMYNHPIDQAVLREVLQDGDWVAAEVLARLGASRGESLCDLARSINATTFLELYERRCRPEGVTYRAGGWEYQLTMQAGKLKVL